MLSRQAFFLLLTLYPLTLSSDREASPIASASFRQHAHEPPKAPVVAELRKVRSAFHYMQNTSEKFIVPGKEHPAKNNTRSAWRPKFATPREPSSFALDSLRFTCSEKYTPECRNKTRLFRRKIVETLEKSAKENPEEGPNIYNVSYKPRQRLKSPMCGILRAGLKTLRRKDFMKMSERLTLFDLVPKRKLFDKQNIKSCAVVSSAGSLANSKLGRFIDLHDLVMRFNHAPTEGFEVDVGTKTTIRLINSQVVSKAEFQFLTSPIFRNITIAAWDPCRYNSTLEEWLEAPDFDLFTNFQLYSLDNASRGNFYILDPRSIWRLWETLQDYAPTPIRRNPPSSGFLGISLLIPLCAYIDVVEYIPSVRLNGRCHYYDSEMNPACSFGEWHPLAAEKLMALDMNSADDFAIFQSGILRIRSSQRNECK
ncbi:beta-galactoside alpha-2,6-sialyltransferase 2 [Phlebotomus argentipes]|uniref:beta-galactoside alpha-2,6-sialyltransferase 2 n=1 Tax=Phlebotomus argentipes TaxID=94469 RepID=UPI00289365E4|nr:beta-galactoside alpha-2,6-sialyltransferase 2 [Phlebotomus argentipes]